MITPRPLLSFLQFGLSRSQCRFLSVLVLSTSMGAACSNVPSIGLDAGDGDADADGGTDSDQDSGGDIGDLDGGGGGGEDGPPVCGNGVLTKDEACDDNNTKTGDGCSADCLKVELGFICARPGQKCRPFARCGDGLVSSSEQCDDSGTTNGDGCSELCKIELGHACTNEPGEPSTCETTTCGDNIQEGVETCEDGNALPFDGCNDFCQKEPDCSGASCVSACGDGFVLDEDCDDGNTLSGDGCSSTCEIEDGYTCAPGDLRIPAVFHDFNAQGQTGGISDFEPTNPCDHAVGYVEDTLLADGTPEIVGPDADNASDAEACIKHFSKWYHSDSSVNATIVGSIDMFEGATPGTFVNRMNDGTLYTDLTGTEREGNPFFFPIDDPAVSFTPIAQFRNKARVATGSGEYGTSNTQGNLNGPSEELDIFGLAEGDIDHNFHFTSHIQYWFRYDAETTANFEFIGDDDVWVFVNKKLALDLGGLHSTMGGNFDIDADSAADFSLEDGKVYPISIFHAERRHDGSTFKLTLSGFNPGRSVCVSECGDGIVGGDEECDDGTNNGGQNECAAGCVLGGYCGDGVVQEGEDCDNGPSDATCSGCRHLIIK